MNGTASFFVDSVYYQPGLMEYPPIVNTTVPMLGSTYYVESLSTSDLSNIRAYLNFGMIASPDYIYAIYDGDGSAEIEHFFEA
jgi:Peptidase family M28